MRLSGHYDQDIKAIHASYMKSLGVSAKELLSLPGLIILFVLFIGVKVGLTNTQFVSSISTFGPWLVTCMAIWIGMRATTRTILEDRKKAAEDFYSVDSAARIDRAFRVFYHLLLDGEVFKKGTYASRVAWDRSVIAALYSHCNATNKDIYLCNTGRTDQRVKLGQIQDIHYESALQHIKHLLDHDFVNAM
jgi:hypothetical protein